MLMLRDSPDCDAMQAQWEVLQGVINYCEGSLKCLLETAKVKPAINYYMVHVGMGQNPTLISLSKFCDENGIRTFGYGAVGEPGPNAELFNSPILKNIGKNHGDKAPEEVALRWVIQGGAAVSVRPTTNFGLGVGVCTGVGTGAGTNGECAKGLWKRAGVFDWKLTEKGMAELTDCHGWTLITTLLYFRQLVVRVHMVHR
uniref:NADP-dependent oxidoreductase domain-containing protein n=1 Tax=Chaetoceros debilis TaxID=122233 RepID=A0A7S3VEB3_9STRA